MNVHDFPENGERFWRSVEPPVRRYLLTVTDAGTADAVLAKLAPVVRRVGDRASRGPATLGGDPLQEINIWVIDIINWFVLELVNRELESIALRTELAGLAAQRQAAHTT